MLTRLGEAELRARHLGSHIAVEPECIEPVRAMLSRIERDGERAVRAIAEELGDLEPDGPLVHERSACEAALDVLDTKDRAVLERTADRIRAFAKMQLECVREGSMRVQGIRAGAKVRPLDSAGCYAPSGRYPLPSTVLMTACVARVAGVRDVTLATPRPGSLMLAAAALAEVDRVLAVGGAQAVGALAYGIDGLVPEVDVIVGPGNRWVTAAKQQVSGHVRIDFLAGPSELVVRADETANPSWIAADLLAQAEHDVDARPILVTCSEALADAVDEELTVQLESLPTAAVAREAIERRGLCVLCADETRAAQVCELLAPEHLEVMGAMRGEEPLRHGALFQGAYAAEVLGDYGAGPNHVLPTGRTARHSGGLSVQHFLATRTWLEVEDPEEARQVIEDAAHLARLEGLEGHARAAERRL